MLVEGSFYFTESARVRESVGRDLRRSHVPLTPPANLRMLRRHLAADLTGGVELEMNGLVLSSGQYQLVYNLFSLVIAAMLAAFVFFLVSRNNVAPRYRAAITVSALVVGIAGYHYFRIFESWKGAFAYGGGEFRAVGIGFNDAYRYVDWLLTVPLLLTETVAVLGLARNTSRSLIARLSIAAVLMIGLGYPGEISSSSGVRALWGTLSTVPFLSILYVLWVELGKSLDRQPEGVKVLVRNMRLLLLATWGVYPIAYLLPMLGVSGASAVVGVQIGYSVADILAKPAFGLMVYAIARLKTEADEAAGGRLVVASQAA